MATNFSKYLAELIGTFTIVFAGCGSIMTAPAEAVPLVFGISVAVMIYAVGHISGAHFNPAVTLAFALTRHFPPAQIPLYWAAQLMGAFAAICLLNIAAPDGFGIATAGAVTLPQKGLAPYQAFIWEGTLTFFLMFVIIAVATDTRAVGVMAGLAIGATVAMGAFVGGSLTGAGMNPARSLAPALFASNFTSLWIYLAAPFAGAALAAYAYEYIRCDAESRAGPKECC